MRFPSPGTRCALAAPFHPCRPESRRSVFCGTFLRVAPTGCCPAPAQEKPGLSSRGKNPPAIASPTAPKARLFIGKNRGKFKWSGKNPGKNLGSSREPLFPAPGNAAPTPAGRIPSRRLQTETPVFAPDSPAGGYPLHFLMFTAQTITRPSKDAWSAGDRNQFHQKPITSRRSPRNFMR